MPEPIDANTRHDAQKHDAQKHDAHKLRQTLDRLRAELLGQRTPEGYWLGELSASALSTATAISAMSAVVLQGQTASGLDDNDVAELKSLITRGHRWLLNQQNKDGGFGDTNRSHSNIATSYLVLAAWTLTAQACDTDIPPSSIDKLQSYIDTTGGITALRERYGKDKTFVVPILCNLAIAGLVDWKQVAALPFEAAVLPQSLYRFVGLPVVSYAIPALVAIGQAKFLKSGCLPPWSFVRRKCIEPSMRVLKKMSPDSGGYLEATPLTAFVVMSLASSGRAGHEVTQRGLTFLKQSIVPEPSESADELGSWPIDTNLATWLTSLATLALSKDPEDDGEWATEDLLRWHLSCQHAERHPFTGVDPGGWGWTDLSGAVPDADDTPGAIVSLLIQREHHTFSIGKEIDRACSFGQDWLLKLQNRDGGIPTFCRGWGKLPFDRSSTDLTAHAIRAMQMLPEDATNKSAAIESGLAFLRREQRVDGSWLPLWFGNQEMPDDINPFYGTAKVLVDVPAELGRDPIVKGINYLISNHNEDGGWGAGGELASQLYPAIADNQQTSTVEETALVLEALASLFCRRDLWRVPHGEETSVPPRQNLDGGRTPDQVRENLASVILSGTKWLVEAIDRDCHHVAWPIGFYFAKLWYHERLYPPIFATAALGRVAAIHDELSAVYDKPVR